MPLKTEGIWSLTLDILQFLDELGIWWLSLVLVTITLHCFKSQRVWTRASYDPHPLAVIALLLHGRLENWLRNPQYVLEAGVCLSERDDGSHLKLVKESSRSAVRSPDLVAHTNSITAITYNIHVFVCIRIFVPGERAEHFHW